MHKCFTFEEGETPPHSWVLKEERLKVKELTALTLYYNCTGVKCVSAPGSHFTLGK